MHGKAAFVVTSRSNRILRLTELQHAFRAGLRRKSAKVFLPTTYGGLAPVFNGDNFCFPLKTLQNCHVNKGCSASGLRHSVRLATDCGPVVSGPSPRPRHRGGRAVARLRMPSSMVVTRPVMSGGMSEVNSSGAPVTGCAKPRLAA